MGAPWEHKTRPSYERQLKKHRAVTALNQVRQLFLVGNDAVKVGEEGFNVSVAGGVGGDGACLLLNATEKDAEIAFEGGAEASDLDIQCGGVHGDVVAPLRQVTKLMDSRAHLTQFLMKRRKLSQEYVDSASDCEEEPNDGQVEASAETKTPTSANTPTETEGSTKTKPSRASHTLPTKNAQGGLCFDLSAKRRVTVSKFNSSVLVDIREFYEDQASGERRPGKKGISLTVDQFSQLKKLLPSIDAAIQQLK